MEEVERRIKRRRVLALVGFGMMTFAPMMMGLLAWLFPGLREGVVYVVLGIMVAFSVGSLFFRLMRCPVCGKHLELRFAQRTKLCNVCRCVVIEGEAKKSDEKALRWVYVGVGLILLSAAVATPFGVMLLNQHQMVAANRGVWRITLPAWGQLGILGLLFLLAWWGGRVKQRRKKEAVVMQPPYPVLTVKRVRGFFSKSMKDRVYRMYLAPGRLCFGRMAGQFYREDDLVMLGGFGSIMFPYLEKKLQEMRRWTAVYDAIDPAGDDLRKIDGTNFQIERAEVEQIRYVGLFRLGWWERRMFLGSAGILEICTNGETLRLGMMENLSEQEVEGILRDWEGEVEAVSSGL